MKKNRIILNFSSVVDDINICNAKKKHIKTRLIKMGKSFCAFDFTNRFNKKSFLTPES